MTEREAQRALRSVPVPEEIEARERVWDVVRAAFEERETVPRRRRSARPIIALAGAAVIAGIAVSPLGGWIRDTIGRERVVGVRDARPALVALPAPGRLLVTSPQGPWVVQANGAKRLLGKYQNASWSPRGLFVVVTRGRQLVAVEPSKGEVRWTVSRPQLVGQPRWSPSGLRVAYRSGSSLRVVVGNGQRDRALAGPVAPVAAAWKPGVAHLLAFADRRGRVRVVNADSRKELWRSAPIRPLRELLWSADGRRLLALGRNRHRVYDARGTLLRVIERPQNRTAFRAAFAPRGHTVAFTEFASPPGRSSVVLVDADRGGAGETLFQGRGKLRELVWSPNGRWLLVAWPPADQWLFIRTPGPRKIEAVSNIALEFDPGGLGVGSVRIQGWCCQQR